MIDSPSFSLSALGGGEGWGEVGGASAPDRRTHLTLPIPTDQVRGLKAHDATGALLLPPMGGEGGRVAGDRA
jgi:hypothetical protein